MVSLQQPRGKDRPLQHQKTDGCPGRGRYTQPVSGLQRGTVMQTPPNGAENPGRYGIVRGSSLPRTVRAGAMDFSATPVVRLGARTSCAGSVPHPQTQSRRTVFSARVEWSELGAAIFKLPTYAEISHFTDVSLEKLARLKLSQEARLNTLAVLSGSSSKQESIPGPRSSLFVHHDPRLAPPTRHDESSHAACLQRASSYVCLFTLELHAWDLRDHHK